MKESNTRAWVIAYEILERAGVPPQQFNYVRMLALGMKNETPTPYLPVSIEDELKKAEIKRGFRRQDPYTEVAAIVVAPPGMSDIDVQTEIADPFLQQLKDADLVLNLSKATVDWCTG